MRRKNDSFSRAVSFITAALFLWTNTAAGSMTNIRGQIGSSASSLGEQQAQQLEAFKESLPAALCEQIKIPASLGYVEDRFVGTDPRFVLIVKDIHANYEAQTNLAHIMQFLQTGKTRGNFQLLALEGADSQIDPSLFKAMDNLDVRSQLVDYFVKEGSLTGAERWIIEANTPVKGFGVEKAEAYLTNLDFFRKSHEQKEAIRKDLQKGERIVRMLKPKVFTPEIQEIVEKANQFASDKIQLTDYCAFLNDWAKKWSIPTDAHMNFSNVIKLGAVEKTLIKAKLQGEKTSLVQTLQKKLVKEEGKALLEKTLLFKLGKISNAEFYAYLMQQAKKAGLDLATYSNLEKFAQMAKLMEQIAITKVNAECDLIVDQIKEKLYKNPEQRDLDQLDAQVATMNRLLDLSLTRDELGKYEANRVKWSGEQIAKFLTRLANNYGLGMQIGE